MSRIPKPTIVEPTPPPGNFTMAYLREKKAYHEAWRDYYAAKAARSRRYMWISLGIALGAQLVAISFQIASHIH